MASYLTHREIVLELFKVLDTKDYAKVEKFLSPNFHHVILPKSTGGFGAPSRDWAQLQQFLGELDNVIEVYALKVVKWIESGDELVAHYFSEGKLRSGSPYRNEYIGIFTFRNGKLEHFEEMMDSKYLTEIISGGA